MRSQFDKNQVKNGYETELGISPRKGNPRQRCNLCKEVFRAASKFHRFCKACRQGNELFRFSEWLPSNTN